MLGSKDFPFPWNGSELLAHEYEKDNYIVIRTGSKTGRAIIFFAGNGLYFPNTESEFTEKIIKNDRYEWENIITDKRVTKYYELIILVRDIYKQWYITGISAKINTVEKTADFLKDLTAGLEITTCGSSAGGYASVLFAHLLNAERFFTIAAQFSIKHQISSEAPFVLMNASNPAVNKYYDISNFIQGGGGYYFYPNKSKIDIPQYELIKNNSNPNFIIIERNSDEHGANMPGFCYPYLLTRSNKELNKIFGEMKKLPILSKWKFARKLLPAGVFIADFTRYLLRKIFSTVKKKFSR